MHIYEYNMIIYIYIYLNINFLLYLPRYVLYYSIYKSLHYLHEKNLCKFNTQTIHKQYINNP